MHILFLSRWFPFPPNNGSKIRINNLLRGLSGHHTVSLLSFMETDDAEPDIAAAAEVCRSVRVIRRKPFTPESWSARLAYFSFAPRSVIDTFSPEMALAIKETLAAEKIDLVVASQVDMAVYSRYFRGLPAIFEEVETGVLYEQFARAESPLQRLRFGLTWAKHRRYLRLLFKDFQACTVVSAQERVLLQRVVGGMETVEVLPNCIDLADYVGVNEPPQPGTLVFMGAFSYNPNYEAMVWFVEKVLPIIQSELPGVRLTITGNHQNRPLPPAENVTLTGFVDDIRPLVARSWASIVPLHTGGGTRLKILEAMALGTPVIATPKGAEGLDAEPGRHLLVADSPAAFADSVISVLQDAALRRRLAENGAQLVREKYNWQAILPEFLSLVERVADRHPAG